MFNNRMLAVAAVLALAIPALGAAAPIVRGPEQEQLVEGHTVFTVIEVIRNTTTNQTEFAAAVAVLVREYNAQNQNVRFPGVLWFNDQYLVNPTNQNANNAAFRYPCGGAVMAVNGGDPDPRVSIASPGVIVPAGTYGTYVPGTATAGEDDSWLDTTTGLADPDTGGIDQDPANVDAVASDAFDYVESYLVTDPNDHVWIIDQYTTYTEIGLGGTRTAYSSTVWVVNILGSPVFIPDDGFLSCGPYNDLLSNAYAQYAPVYDSGYYNTLNTADNAVGMGWDASVGSQLPYRDTPPAGYDDPGRNGMCYEGGGYCQTRLYNALLYFQLEDLTNDGAARDHSDPVLSGDTNGCHESFDQSWECPGWTAGSPGSGNDNAEGNSHSFHPTTHRAPDPQDVLAPIVEAGGERGIEGSPEHAEVCPDGFAGTNRANHGGSTDVYGRCDFLHATKNIDVYFSPNGRPFAPLVRNFALLDVSGSGAPFQDYHCSYEAAACSGNYPEPLITDDSDYSVVGQDI